MTDVPDFGDDGTPDSDKPRPPREQLVQRLADAVRRVAAPRKAEVRDDAGTIRIKTDAAGHERVAAMLKAIRDARAPTITVEARFLTIDVDALTKLETPLAAKVHAARVLRDSGAAASITVSREDVNWLIRATQASPKTTMVTAPRVTIYNGQRANVQVVTETPYVKDLKPVKSEGGGEGYDPVITVAKSGVKLDVRATVAADGRTIALHVRPWLSRVIELEPIEKGRAANGEKLIIQRPRSQTFEADLVVPIPSDGGSVLLSGDAVDATGKEPPQPMLILVTAKPAPPADPG